MKVIYLAGPYRSQTIRGVVDNIRYAEAVAIRIWTIATGRAMVYSPHLNTALFDGIFQNDAPFLDSGLEMVDRSDSVVAFGNWEGSEGSIGEVRKAVEKGIPVFDWTHEEKYLRRWLDKDMPADTLDSLVHADRALRRFIWPWDKR